MNKNSMKIKNLFITLSIGIIGVVLYTIIHEGAHALMAIFLGGKISSFDINFLTGDPHISYTGNLGATKMAIISLAGPFIPYLILMGVSIVMNKNKNLLVQKIFLLHAMPIIISLFPSLIISVLFELGFDVSSEDIGSFIQGMGINGYVVACIILCIIVLSILYINSKIHIKKAFLYVPVIKGKLNRRVNVIMITFVTISLVLLMASAINIISQTIHVNKLVGPRGHGSYIDLNIEDIKEGESEIYEFSVEKVMFFDFKILANINSIIELKLISSCRLPFQRSNELQLCSGLGKINANMTRFLLEPGEYKIHLYKSGGKGKLRLYINEEEALINESDVSYVSIEEEIIKDKIPKEKLIQVAKARLDNYAEKTIYEFEVEKDTYVDFSAYLTTEQGKAVVKVIGDNFCDEIIGNYQIYTTNRRVELKKGKYSVEVTCSDCDGDIYLFNNKSR